MSLQVWLPLNGNLDNQGISQIPKLSFSSQSWDTNGKLGQCLKIPKVVSNTITVSNLINKKIFSFSCWMYLDTSFTNSSYTKIFSLGHVSDGEEGYIRIETIPTNGEFQIIYNKSASHGSNNVTYYGITGGATNAAKNKWVHIAITNDGTKVRTYFDGVLKGTYIITNIYDKGYLNGNFYLGGSYVNLNDVRIYDHALSPKEVKEIAKGLIVHYKLDSKFIDKIIDCSGFLNNGEIVGALSFDNNSPRYEQSCSFNGNSCIKTLSPTTEAKTMACWIYIGNTLPVSKVISVDYKTKMALGFSSDSCIINTCDSNNRQKKRNVSNYIVKNNWNHIVTDKSNNLYINGELIPIGSLDTSYWSQTSDELIIGSRYSSSNGYNYFWNGKISDFRLYATILSEDEVKELYNTAAWVAPNAMAAYELKEV